MSSEQAGNLSDSEQLMQTQDLEVNYSHSEEATTRENPLEAMSSKSQGFLLEDTACAVSVSLDGKMRVWDTRKDKCLKSIQVGGINSVWVNGGEVTIGRHDGSVDKIEVKTKTQALVEESAPSTKSAEEKPTEEESYWFEKTIGMLPQETVVQSETEIDQVVLFRSLLGRIVSRRVVAEKDSSISVIEIFFSESSFHKNIFISNNYNLSLASMSSPGALLASRSEEDNSSNLRPKLYFKSFEVENDWLLSLPWGENPETLCVGNTFACVFTEKNYLRFFSLEGIQTYIVSLGLKVISMASSADKLALFYLSSTPLLGNQNISVEIWHTENLGVVHEPEEFLKEEAKVAVTPQENLTWGGFSAEGMLCTVDSAGVVRGLWPRVGHWVPLATLKEISVVIGVGGGEVVGLKESSSVPTTEEFKIPVLPNSELEEQHMKLRFEIENERLDSDTSRIYSQLDKISLRGFIQAINSEDTNTALGYAKLLCLEKSKAIAFNMAKQKNQISLIRKLGKELELEVGPAKASRPPAPKKSSQFDDSVLQEKPKTQPNQKPELKPNPFANNSQKETSLFEELPKKRRSQLPNTTSKKSK